MTLYSSGARTGEEEERAVGLSIMPVPHRGIKLISFFIRVIGVNFFDDDGIWVGGG